MLAAMAETGLAGKQEEQVRERTPPPTLDDSPTLSARSSACKGTRSWEMSPVVGTGRAGWDSPQLFDERTLKAGHFLLLHEPRRRSKQGQHGGLLCAQPGRERRGVVFRSWEVRGR